MKLIKSNSEMPKEINYKNCTANDLSQGVTSRLLEKYKPKVDCNIETMHSRKDQKGVA